LACGLGRTYRAASFKADYLCGELLKKAAPAGKPRNARVTPMVSAIA